MARFLPALLLLAAPVAAFAADRGNVDLPRYPSLSPDGRTIVFTWRGDLWSVPTSGGTALRLTANPGDDVRSAWSPDGSSIAFESDRDGYRNIWLMRPDGTDVRQLTRLDTPVTLSAFGSDGKGGVVVTFDAARENDLFRSGRPYQVSVAGGGPQRVHDAFGSHAVPSRDGSVILFERGGSTWARRGYRGSDNRDVWIFDRRTGSFRQLTSWAGNDGLAQWIGDSDVLYVSDQDAKAVNVFRRPLAASASEQGRQLTHFTEDVRDLTVSADGSTAAFTVWDTLYRLDLKKPGAEPEVVTLRANEDSRDNTDIRKVDRDVTAARLNPDGKSMAFVAYGDLYVKSMDEKAGVVRITDTPAHEQGIEWSPDGTKLYFVSDESGRDGIYEATVVRSRGEIRKDFAKATKGASDANGDAKGESKSEPKSEPKNGPKPEPGRWAEAVTFAIKPLVVNEFENHAPDPSPDGKWLAYRRGVGTLMLRDTASGEERTLRPGWDPSLAWRWSPDSRYIAFQQEDRDFNSDIWIVPVEGSAPAVNITRHPRMDVDPRWSADGRVLAFRSDRTGGEFDVWAVYLDKELEGYSRQELETYFKDAAEAAKKRKPLHSGGGKSDKPDTSEKPEKSETKEKADKEVGADKPDAPDKGEGGSEDADKKAKSSPAKPPTLSLDDAYLRVRRITSLLGNEGDLEMTPGGDRLIFTAGGQPDPERDGPNRGGDSSMYSVKWDGTDQKKLGPSADIQQVSLTGDKVVFVKDGRVSTVAPAGGEAKGVDFAATKVIDRKSQSEQKFLEAARLLGEGFYHPTMKDTDWPSLTRKYLQLAQAARTNDEFDFVANRFIGELNASHLGITSPATPHERQPQGRLGVRTKPVEGGFQITAIVPESPATHGPTPLEVGDVIVAVAGKRVSAPSTLEELLRGRVGEETLVTIRRALADGSSGEIDCLQVPCDAAALGDLAYKATRLRNARLVNEWSGGRLGYIHIQGMSQPSLDEFERDLYAAAEGKDGLIIDVRNNGGGWTADRLLGSIMAPYHAYTVPRGADASYKLGYPRDRLFIQRYTLPIDMLCNEKSFSNAEITAHAFKTLKRGTLVGQQTYGGVISTGAAKLLDGTTVRMPFRGWYLPDGTDMENHGAMPDLLVPQTPEDESSDMDAQLKAAVDDLVKRAPTAGKRSNGG